MTSFVIKILFNVSQLSLHVSTNQNNFLLILDVNIGAEYVLDQCWIMINICRGSLHYKRKQVSPKLHKNKIILNQFEFIKVLECRSWFDDSKIMSELFYRI